MAAHVFFLLSQVTQRLGPFSHEMAQISFPGHRYGNTLVPMTEDDKTNMKYKAEKCFKVLGFTKAENVSE